MGKININMLYFPCPLQFNLGHTFPDVCFNHSLKAYDIKMKGRTYILLLFTFIN